MSTYECPTFLNTRKGKKQALAIITMTYVNYPAYAKYNYMYCAVVVSGGKTFLFFLREEPRKARIMNGFIYLIESYHIQKHAYPVTVPITEHDTRRLTIGNDGLKGYYYPNGFFLCVAIEDDYAFKASFKPWSYIKLGD